MQVLINNSGETPNIKGRHIHDKDTILKSYHSKTLV